MNISDFFYFINGLLRQARNDISLFFYSMLSFRAERGNPLIYIFLIFTFLVWGNVNGNQKLTINLTNQQQQKMKLLFGLIKPTPLVKEVTQHIKQDISCQQQKLMGFEINIQEFESIPSKKVCKQLSSQGFLMAVFFQAAGEHAVEWRLYDMGTLTMQRGKKITVQNQPEIQKKAHHVADTIWALLTGQPGIFSTNISYCMERKVNGHVLSDIYYKTPTSIEPHCLVRGGKLLAPRWNNNNQNPLLLYSEVTPTNIRLMATNLDGKRYMVSNFDGLTMLPSVSNNGEYIAYCATYKGTSQIYCSMRDPKTNRKISYRKTHNAGNNTSPTVCNNGDIIFCSDFEMKTPQIYYLHGDTDVLDRITNGGYCACPHFCQKNNKIVYCKLVEGYMQLFTYDMHNKHHTQITFSKENKDECCWSPCGNYVICSVDKPKGSRIALLNMTTQEQLLITPEGSSCLYPSWSGVII